LMAANGHTASDVAKATPARPSCEQPFEQIIESCNRPLPLEQLLQGLVG